MFRPCEGIIPAFRSAVGQGGVCFAATGIGPGIEWIGPGHVSRNVIARKLSMLAARRNG